MNDRYPITEELPSIINLSAKSIKAIGDYVFERIKPLITANRQQEEDTIFDVEGLSAYLKVDKNWIYQRTRKHEIPFIKKGKYCLFRKSVIDAWMNQDAVKPLSPFNIFKKW